MSVAGTRELHEGRGRNLQPETAAAVPRADGIHRWTGLSELGDLTKVAKNPYIVRIGRFLIFFTPDTFAGSPVVLTLRLSNNSNLGSLFFMFANNITISRYL